MKQEKVFCESCIYKNYSVCNCPELAKDSYYKPKDAHPDCSDQNGKNNCKYFEEPNLKRFFRGIFGSELKKEAKAE